MAALLACTAGISQVGRARNCGGSPRATPATLVMLPGTIFHTLSGTTRLRAPVTSCVVLGTLVSGLGFDVLEPGLEFGSRVIGEGVGKGDCRVFLRHGGWVGGWMDGWMDGWMKN